MSTLIYNLINYKKENVMRKLVRSAHHVIKLEVETAENVWRKCRYVGESLRILCDYETLRNSVYIR